MAEIKNWKIKYDHKDGRQGTIEVRTEIGKSKAFNYGNQKNGALIVNGCLRSYDLRYCKEKDLHRAMITEYFGEGLVKAKRSSYG